MCVLPEKPDKPQMLLSLSSGYPEHPQAPVLETVKRHMLCPRDHLCLMVFSCASESLGFLWRDLVKMGEGGEGVCYKGQREGNELQAPPLGFNNSTAILSFFVY